MNKQSGFAAVEIVLVLVVVAVVGFTAFTVFTRNNEAAVANVPAAPQITAAADLTTAETTLDQLDIDANAVDSTELDTELNAF